jgi:hypothetical protein
MNEQRMNFREYVESLPEVEKKKISDLARVDLKLQERVSRSQESSAQNFYPDINLKVQSRNFYDYRSYLPYEKTISPQVNHKDFCQEMHESLK